MARFGSHTTSAVLVVLLLVPGVGYTGVNAWTYLGPDGGGARSLIVDPLSPDTVYAVTDAGLFKSTDAAETWSIINPSPADGSGYSLVVDPQNAGTLYAASTSVQGRDALFKSTDGGATWRALQSGSVYGLSAPLAIDPSNTNILYSGNYSAILKSTNGGRTWNLSTAGLPVTCCLDVHTLTIDQNDPTNVYALLNSGLFKSTDRGGTWQAVYRYAGALDFQTVTLDPRNSGVLYGVHPAGGIFKSTDGGASWSAANSGLHAANGNFGSYAVNSLAIDPQDSRTLYAGTSYGLYKSADGGTSWTLTNFGLGMGPIGPVTVDPWNSGTVYASELPPFARSVYKSVDGGTNWMPANVGLRAVRIGGLLIDPQHPATLYAANFFGTFKSTDAGVSWREFALPKGAGGLLLIDPKDTNTLYVGAGRTVIKTQDGGATWTSMSTGLPEGCTFISSLATDPQDTNTIYAAFRGFGDVCESRSNVVGGLWKSADGGATWSQAGSQPKGGGLHGMVIDPLNHATVYGWNGMGIYKSKDRGASWETLDLGFTDRVYVSTVVVDPQTPGTLYAVSGGHGILKSSDGGASWSAVNSRLPMSTDGNPTVTSLVIDPRNPGILYATEWSGAGVFRSTDGGASWRAVNTGLATLDVNAVAIDPQDTRTVYAGTAGGVFTITFTEDEL